MYGTASLSTLYPGTDRASARSAVWKYKPTSSRSKASGSLIHTHKHTDTHKERDLKLVMPLLLFIIKIDRFKLMVDIKIQYYCD